MKKRIFPVLLSFVLLFSLVPPVFAAGNFMTLVQETAGDPDKEFVYYISAFTGSVNILQENVEKIDVKMFKKCNCDFTVFSFQENPDDLWERHIFSCGKNYLNGPDTLYKITLKSGEKVTFYTKSNRAYIYAEQEDGYDLSYSTDGKNFTSYVNDGSIYLSEQTVALIRFNTAQDGTLTMKRTDPNAPAPVEPVEPVQPTQPVQPVQPVQPTQPAQSATAMPTNDALWVNGQLRNATVYKIDGSNYFKIRDLAAVLNGTGKQFSVGYDAASKSVTATTGYAYQAVGGELSGAAPSSQTAAVSNDTVIVNGAVARNVTVYKIDGSNYFKLRDLGNALGFPVDYEAGKGMIINTETAAAAACSHNWATRHVDEVGHDEPGVGVHQQIVFGCACGFTVVPEDDDGMKQWIQHQKTCDKDDEDYTTWYIDVPNGPYHVVDTPAHDEVYCTLCGAVQ